LRPGTAAKNRAFRFKSSQTASRFAAGFPLQSLAPNKRLQPLVAPNNPHARGKAGSRPAAAFPISHSRALAFFEKACYTCRGNAYETKKLFDKHNNRIDRKLRYAQ
jgi:hypothetical protein